MPQELQKSTSGKEIVKRVVTGLKYEEEVGYDEWYQVETMDGDTYKISEAGRDAILNSKSDFYELGSDFVARHQIKKITRERSYFGPRSGGA